MARNVVLSVFFVVCMRLLSGFATAQSYDPETWERVSAYADALIDIITSYTVVQAEWLAYLDSHDARYGSAETRLANLDYFWARTTDAMGAMARLEVPRECRSVHLAYLHAMQMHRSALEEFMGYAKTGEESYRVRGNSLMSDSTRARITALYELDEVLLRYRP